MTSISTAKASPERISGRRLWWVGPLTIAAAVIAVLIVRSLAVALLAPASEFMPLWWGPPIVFTVVGVLGAVLVFAAVGRWARRPIWLFQIIAAVVLVISFIPDIMLLLANPAPYPGITPGTVGALIVMHIVAWAVSVGLLTTLAREQ